ncbi:MAG: TIGR00296 family protein, partial [Methanophagales archaeon]|nr:TIGR00296 family protein [Methanophagales archaeon]
MSMLTEEEGKEGLKLARAAIEKYLSENIKIKDGEDLPVIFEEKRGVFVTLNKYGDLRGCIGYPYPIFKLKEAIIDAAISAAVNDPRFPSVTKEEIGDIVIEITILTTPQVLKTKPKDLPKQVEIGRHGLIVKRGIYQGLLLPQVATEYNWSAEEFLCQTCWKAGLPQDAWLEEDTEVSTFEGQIFKEE